MSSAVRSSKRRIMADVRELHTDPSDQYAAAPRETDIFEWDFAIRGPPGTPFEGGVYHGRIILPTEYPFKPPHIMLLTENGRWEVGKKICLSISAYHPEEWQPAWGVRTILEAIIAFMPTDGNGAIGAVDFDDAERRRLARLSQSYAHANMPMIPPLRTAAASSPDSSAAPVTNRYAAEIAQMQIGIAPTRADAGADEGGAAAAVATGGSPSSASSSSAAAAAATVAAAAAAVTSAAAALRAPGSTSGGGGGGGSTTAASGGGSSSTARAAAAPPASKQSPAPPRQPPVPLVPVPTPTPAPVAAPAPAAAPAPPRPPGDQALVLIATALVIAIIAIVLRKVLRRLDVLEDSA